MLSVKSENRLESSATPCQIDTLVDFLRTIKRHPKGWNALHLHYSVLDRLHQQPINRRMVATAFSKLVQAYEGQIFWQSNFDLFFLVKDCPGIDLDAAIFDSQRALDDSPVIKTILKNGKDRRLYDNYDLAVDYDKFTALAESLQSLSEEEAAETSKGEGLREMVAQLDLEAAPKEKPVPAAPPLEKISKEILGYDYFLKSEKTPPMRSQQLSQLEQGLRNIEMDGLTNEQTACVIFGNSAPQPIFTEIFVSSDAVGKTLLPGYEITAHKWLFQHLTATFDIKLMQMLEKNRFLENKVRSLNLHMSNILSPEFDRFIIAYKKQVAEPLILEINLSDLISDLTTYYEVHKKINALGCRICIDGMDIQAMSVLDRELLNVDFLKIYWNKNYPALLDGNKRKNILDTIQRQGPMRVILYHCEDERATDFGRELGIHIFQGFHVDKLRHNFFG